MTYDPDEPTDLDQVTDHPFTPGPWDDDCWHESEIGPWPCGFTRAEHADPEPEGVAATP